MNDIDDNTEYEEVVVNVPEQDKKTYLLDQMCFMGCGIILFILLVWVLSNTPIIGNYINSVVQSGVMQLAILTGVIVKNQEESYV